MILLIDNYDSFSYNLYQLIGAIEPDIRVIRNDELAVSEITAMRPDGIIISPGPGRPEDAGIITELVRTLGNVDRIRADNADMADEYDGYIPDASEREELRSSIDKIMREKGCDGVTPIPGLIGTKPDSAKAAERPIPLLGVCLGHQAICQAFGGTIGYARELMHGKQSMTEFDNSSVIFADVPHTAPVARYHSLALDERTLPHELKITARTTDGDVMAVEHRTLPIYGMQFHPESIMTPDGEKMLRAFIELTRH